MANETKTVRIIDNAITLKEAVSIIFHHGAKGTVMLEGEPGIGKSMILKALAKMLPGYVPAYIDVADLSLGDLAVPWFREVNGMQVMSLAPNERFQLHTGAPLILMLDEFTKGQDEVKNMLLPVILERRLGQIPLPEGSLVFLTGNLSTDGVGDKMKAHVRNRISCVRVRKPTAKEWIADYAIKRKLNPTLIAWCSDHEHAFASYLDGDKNNPYIFNPKNAGQTAFVSPRSLERVSEVLDVRDRLGVATAQVVISGYCGDAFARDLSTYVDIADKLPTRESVRTNPLGTRVPDETAPKLILTYTLITEVDKKTIRPYSQYVNRMDRELQALFYTMVAEKDMSIIPECKEALDWATKNAWIL